MAVCILKIGGSVITDKSREDSARIDEIKRIAGEIAPSSDGLVLVHGAGSYGHIPAKRYGLPSKFDPVGIRITHTSVAELNSLVVEALGDAGARPLPIHPLSCVVLRNGRIESMDLAPVKAMLASGLLPVLHGDVAADSINGAGIVSGDQLITYMATALGASIVALGTDVDGVLVDGKPMPEITRKDLTAAVGGSAGVDVTGGMKGKLEELLDLADKGMSSTIFNARKAGLISRALRGEDVGTSIRAPSGGPIDR